MCFAEAQKGLKIEMVPEGLHAGFEERYMCTVVERQAAGVVVLWNTHSKGGPPASLNVQRLRLESRTWFDLGGDPTMERPRRSKTPPPSGPFRPPGRCRMPPVSDRPPNSVDARGERRKAAGGPA